MNWYLARLKSMSIKEIVFYRSARFIKNKFFKNSVKPADLSRCTTRFSLAGQYNPDRFRSLSDIHENLLEFGLFNTKLRLDHPIHWRKDYKNNKVSPLAPAAKISRQHFNLHGDIKYLAELSRFYHFPFFAFKYAASRENRYLHLLKEHLGAWMQQNPFLRSIHWTSGMEVAIRSVNLVYALLILEALGLPDPDFDVMARELLGKNYGFLKNNLSKYSSANNHRVAELCGLVVTASYFENDLLNREIKYWKQLLIKELHIQILDDGVHMELSTRYHAEVLDHFFNAFLFLEKSEESIPEEVYEKLRKSFQFVHDCKYGNHVNEFGDSDDGHLIYPYFEKDYNIYQSLLNSARIKFGLNFKAPLKTLSTSFLRKKESPTPGLEASITEIPLSRGMTPPGFLETPFDADEKIDLRNYLLFGEKCFAQKPAKPAQKYTDKLYEKGGYCFMHDDREQAKLTFDVGPIGDHLLAAHGHSDLLHFTFELCGTPFIIDPGTFQYHSKDLFWRQYFRGIFAHNTISVDDRQHAFPATRMSWINKPVTKIVNYSSTREYTQCVAEHHAFNSRYSKTIHRRSIEMNRNNKSIIIRDHLIKHNKTNSKAEFLLHFHPSVKVERRGETVVLHRGKRRIVLKNDYFAKARLYFGDETRPMGWFSGKFDLKEPANTLSATVFFGNSLAITTVIDYCQK